MLFKRKSLKSSAGAPDEKERVARRMADFLLRWQRRWAHWLQKKTNGMRASVKWLLLGLFCLLFGGGSLYALYSAFTGPVFHGRFSRPAQLSVPAYYSNTGEGEPKSIRGKEYDRISGFRRYLDSLQATGSGKPIADSLFVARPGLLDSLHLLEKIYSSQFNQ